MSNNKNDEFLPCPKRQRLVQFHADGTKTPVFRCTEPTADAMGTDVTPDVCEACPVRSLIAKAAMRNEAYSPPLVETVYKDLRDKVPDSDAKDWPPCLDRKLVIIGGCCGEKHEIRICESADHFRSGAEVNRGHCVDCPVRRES